MEHAVVSFVSPKGYGMARLSRSGDLVFIPAKLMEQTILKMDDEIAVRAEAAVNHSGTGLCATAISPYASGPSVGTVPPTT